MVSRIVQICFAGWLAALAGCGMSEIQNERATIAEMGKTVMFRLVENAKIDQSNFTAQGKVINPKYQYTWFGGVGPYSVGSIEAIGVEVEASAAGGGVGSAALDQDLRDKLYQILQRRDIGEEQRKALWAETVQAWLVGKTTAEAVQVIPAQPAPAAQPDSTGAASQPVQEGS